MSNTLREEISKYFLQYYDNDASRDRAVEKLSLLIEDVVLKFKEWDENLTGSEVILWGISDTQTSFTHFINNIYNGTTNTP